MSFNSPFPYEMRPVCQDLYERLLVRRENGDAFVQSPPKLTGMENLGLFLKVPEQR